MKKISQDRFKVFMKAPILRTLFILLLPALGRDLFKRTKPILDEGDIFTRENLESAIRSVAKLRGIYPVTLDNVVIRLVEADRRINILFCLDEKPKK